MATKKILFEDFYKSTIIDTIPDSWDISFEVWQAPMNKMWFIIVNPESLTLRERMFYHDVVWNRIYVRWVNRYSPKEHLSWSTIQINDSALIFNYLSENISTTFWIEKLWWLNINVWWWPLLSWTTMLSVNDTTLVLSNNTTNYIYLDLDNNTIKSATSEEFVISDNWIITAEIITTWWQVSTINYRKYSIIKWLPWVQWANWKSAYEIAVEWWFVWTEEQWLNSLKWDKWDTWAIWTPTSTWQYISDAVVVDTWLYTVTTDNSTWIRITENATWKYTEYSLIQRIWANAWNEISNKETISWTWWTIWLLQWIIYSDWLTIDTNWTIRYTWQPAYRDKNNLFIKETINTFDWDVIFNWWVSFPYYRIDMTWTNVINYDWLNWENQKCINLTTTWVKTLNFNNLFQWRTYWLIINNNSWWNITLVEWTITNWNWVTSIFSLWTQISTLSLAPWPHFFFMASADTWIHISYSWKSWAF